MGLRNARPRGAAKCRGAYGSRSEPRHLWSPPRRLALACGHQRVPASRTAACARAKARGCGRKARDKKRHSRAGAQAPHGQRAHARAPRTEAADNDDRSARATRAPILARTVQERKRKGGGVSGPVGGVVARNARGVAHPARARRKRPEGARSRNRTFLISDRRCAARRDGRARDKSGKRAPAENCADAAGMRAIVAPPKRSRF